MSRTGLRKAQQHIVTEDYCMAFSINTNLAALNAHRNLSKIDDQRNNTLERLSTGLRINRAADDASGLTIANGFQAQALGIGQAIQNTIDATSLTQIADGALQEATNILNTIRTKAVQAASDVQDTETRRLIQNDIDRLLGQLNNIAENTSFNGQKLLSGAFSNKVFQIGANAHQTVSVSIGSTEPTRLGHVSTADLALTNADGGDVQLEITSSITGEKLDLNTISLQANNKAENGLGALATEINRYSSTTGISANAVVSTTGAAAITAGTTGANFVINGVTIGALNVQNHDADGALVKGINAKTAETGITASTTTDGKLVLSSNDGRAIQVSGDLGTVGGSTAAELSTFGHLHLVQSGVSTFQISGVGVQATGSAFTLGQNTTTASDSVLAAGSLIADASTLAEGSVLGADVELTGGDVTTHSDSLIKAGSVLLQDSVLVKGTQASGTVGVAGDSKLVQDATLKAGSILADTATVFGKGTVVTTAFTGQGVSAAATRDYAVGETLTEAVTLDNGSDLTLTSDLTLEYNAAGIDNSVIGDASTLVAGSVLGSDTTLGGDSTLSSDLSLKRGSVLAQDSDLLTGSTLGADSEVGAVGGGGEITTSKTTQVKAGSVLLADSVLTEKSTLGGSQNTIAGDTTLAHDQLLKTGSVLADASVLEAGTKLTQEVVDAGGSTISAGAVLTGDLTLDAATTLSADLNLKAGSVLITASVLAENTDVVASVGLSNAKTSRLSDLNVLTSEGAQTAISIADAALKDISNTRASLGSVQNQLSSAVANLSVTLTNVNAAESGIRDVDFATEAGNFSRLQILSQAGAFALSQANAAAQSVLSLLQR
jgi:flagellin